MVEASQIPDDASQSEAFLDALLALKEAVDDIANAQSLIENLWDARDYYYWHSHKDEIMASIDKLKSYPNEKPFAKVMHGFAVEALQKVDDAAKHRHKVKQERKARKSKSKKKTAGYVYLVYSPSTPAYKIGHTVDPNNRAKTFSVQLPYEDIKFIALIETDDRYALETELHERYADKRVGGEWFELTDEDVKYIQSLQGEDDDQ